MTDETKCPFCGAGVDPDYPRVYECGTGVESTYRSSDCYDDEIAQQQARNKELERGARAMGDAVKEAVDLLRYFSGADCFCDHSVGLICESCMASEIAGKLERAWEKAVTPKDNKEQQ